MTEEQRQQSNLSSFEDEEIGIGRQFKKDRTKLSVRGLVFVLVVILLVICSFWISFLVGRKLLTPENQIKELEQLGHVEEVELPKHVTPEKKPARKIEPVPPVMPVIEEPVPAPAIVKPAVKKPAKAKAVKRPVPAEEEVSEPVSSGLYTVRAGSAGNKEDAVNMVEKLRADGIEAFQKESGGTYVIQAGVFRSKANAQKLVDELEAKGYKAKIVE